MSGIFQKGTVVHKKSQLFYLQLTSAILYSGIYQYIFIEIYNIFCVPCVPNRYIPWESKTQPYFHFGTFCVPFVSQGTNFVYQTGLLNIATHNPLSMI